MTSHISSFEAEPPASRSESLRRIGSARRVGWGDSAEQQFRGPCERAKPARRSQHSATQTTRLWPSTSSNHQVPSIQHLKYGGQTYRTGQARCPRGVPRRPLQAGQAECLGVVRKPPVFVITRISDFRTTTKRLVSRELSRGRDTRSLVCQAGAWRPLTGKTWGF